MIAVHAGAGYHSPALEAAYNRDLAEACRAGAAALASGDALDAVAAAIRVLEASPHCNAGHGSNLSFGGCVECDASVMAGDGTFGAVAAAPGIQHPVDAAALLARESRQPLSHGRVRPIMLAGDRAREWALSRGLPAAATPEAAASMHLTDKTRRQWSKYRRLVGGSGDDVANGGGGGSDGAPAGPREEQARGEVGQAVKRSRLSGDGQQQQQQRSQEAEGPAGRLYDTVGCVVLAPGGHVAAGVSSGGIVLKTEGRVGEAAMYGAGCWAQQAQQQPQAGPGQQQPQQDERSQRQQHHEGAAVACSVTGVGETIMRHLLARECCAAAAAAVGAAQLPRTAAQQGDEDGGGGEEPLAEVAAALLRHTVLIGPPPHDCGLLCLRAQPLEGGGGGAGGVAAAQAGGGQQEPRRRYAVEVAVAHCAQSMAFGHVTCGGGGKAAAPVVAVLRRAADCTGRMPDVQTYTRGAVAVL